ncbi:hypothetical protein AKJ16_DCAP16506, partial [Drosera capensis]
MNGKKTPGWSYIEVDREIEGFVAGRRKAGLPVNAAEAKDANEVEENDEPDEASDIGKANKTTQIDEAGNGETTGFRILGMNMDGMPGK